MISPALQSVLDALIPDASVVAGGFAAVIITIAAVRVVRRAVVGLPSIDASRLDAPLPDVVWFDQDYLTDYEDLQSSNRSSGWHSGVDALWL